MKHLDLPLMLLRDHEQFFKEMFQKTELKEIKI